MNPRHNSYIYWIGITPEGEPDFIDAGRSVVMARLFRSRVQAKQHYAEVRRVTIQPPKVIGYAFVSMKVPPE